MSGVDGASKPTGVFADLVRIIERSDLVAVESIDPMGMLQEALPKNAKVGPRASPPGLEGRKGH